MALGYSYGAVLHTATCMHVVLKCVFSLTHCFAGMNRTSPAALLVYTGRSPELVCVFQLVGIALSNSVLLNWLLLSADKTFPCPAAQLVSYLSE